MRYTLDDVTKADAATVGNWAKDPRFFYVYINDGISDPAKAEESGKKYAGICDMALEGRKAVLKVSEFDGSLPSRLAQKALGKVFEQVVKTVSPWDRAYAKGLRDEDGTLLGMTLLLHEKKTGKTEIGYMLGPDHQGKGLGTSMVMSTLKWALENTTDVQTLKADVDPANTPSCGILRKLGLENVGECNPAGPYKDRDGTPIPSQILEGSKDSVTQAVQDYVDRGGTIFPVSDVILDAKMAAAPSAQRTHAL